MIDLYEEINELILQDEIDLDTKLSKFKEWGFSDEQIDEIRFGIECGLEEEISYYARIDMPPKEMAYLRKKLFHDLKTKENLLKEVLPKQEDKISEDEILFKQRKARLERFYIALGFFSFSTICFCFYILSLFYWG